MCQQGIGSQDLWYHQICAIEVIVERIEIHKGPHLNNLDKYEPEPPPPPPPPPSPPVTGEDSPTNGKKGKSKSKSRSKSKSPTKEPPPTEGPAEPPVFGPPAPPKVRVGPPFRVGLNVFHFKNVQIMQVDVPEPEEETEPDKPKPKSKSGNSFCLDTPPVDPKELTEALEAVQEGNEPPKAVVEPEVPDAGDEKWGINSPTSFRKGIACVFIAKPEDLIKSMQRSPLRIKVERFDGYEAYQVGRTDVKIPYNFQTSLLNTHKLINEPISNYVEGTFPLLDTVGEPIGEMEVYFSFTCYGGRIQADFLATDKGLYNLLNNYCYPKVCHIPQTRKVNICSFSEKM